MIDPATLRALPKVELHCHLEGSLRPSTLIELADAHGVPLPSRDPDALYDYADLAGFLAVYEIACRAMISADDFARVTYESLEDAATSANVDYREMFFNPGLHPGVAYPDMLAGIIAGIDAARTDHGIRTRIIPSIYRQMPLSSAREMVELVIEHRRDEVIGIGLDGDEIADPPGKFAAIYAEAAAAGLRCTAHVAHDGPADFIRTVLDDLGCDRIDHGYHVIDDPRLVAELREAAVPFMCATPTPPICGWPTDLARSPIRRMIDEGLTVILNSDDPTMLHTDLGEEFVRVCNGWDLPTGRARTFITDAIDASWMDDTEKTETRSRLLPEVDRLLGPEPTDALDEEKRP